MKRRVYPVIHQKGGLHRTGWCFLTVGLVLAAALASPRLFAITITEILYHPQAGEEELEYIEIFNETRDPIDITGYRFSRGVEYGFTERTFLGPHEYLVICANQEAVTARYGITNTVGDWDPTTALDNGGETLELVSSTGVVVASVRYNDRGQWPAGADGTGHSLELRNVHAAPAFAASWALSGVRGGSPGTPNPEAVDAAVVSINELFVDDAIPPGETGHAWVEFFNAGSVAVELGGFHLSTDRDVLPQTLLPEGTSVPPRGWFCIDAAGIGLSLSPDPDNGRVFVALSRPGGDRVVDAASVALEFPGFSQARFPDGALGFEPAAAPTKGAANQLAAPREIVINEIHYHPLDDWPGLLT
jgi:hypothetical protein